MIIGVATSPLILTETNPAFVNDDGYDNEFPLESTGVPVVVVLMLLELKLDVEILGTSKNPLIVDKFDIVNDIGDEMDIVLLYDNVNALFDTLIVISANSIDCAETNVCVDK